MTAPHEPFIRRCFDLARLGAGSVSPNPMVGAVLVHDGRIIGEGWHRQYGGPHAEVHCLQSVDPENQPLIPYSTLYCSLEPCFHYGKTPPCVDLVLAHKIPRVVIANTDPNPLVAGQSVAKLRAAGVDVLTGILEAEGRWLNRVFFHWIRENSPYVILKWAQSADGFVGKTGERTAVSGPAALRLVHRWRSEVDAILVGANTAVTDNPRLDARYYPGGRPPLRIAFDRRARIPAGHFLLDDSTETWILGPERAGNWQHTAFFPDETTVSRPSLLQKLHASRRSSLLVEGGPTVLQQFLDENVWNEIRIVESDITLGGGLPAPQIPAGTVLQEFLKLGCDAVRILVR